MIVTDRAPRPQRHLQTGRRRTGGQAMVEFALVAPILFLLLFSIIEFGRYVYTVQILNEAAREGARYAIVHGSQRCARAARCQA